MTQVWDKYGLRSSNNRLNKYIFDLRNALKNIGCDDDVIITLPRVGFKVSESITIEDVLIKEKVASTFTEEKPSKKQREIRCYFFKLSFLKVAMILYYFFMLIALSSGAIKKSPATQKTYSLTGLDGCNVELLKDVPVEIKKIASNVAKKIITNNGIKCTINSVVYLQLSDSVLYGSSGKVFVSHCVFNPSSSSIYLCHNTLEVVHEINS